MSVTVFARFADVMSTSAGVGRDLRVAGAVERRAGGERQRQEARVGVGGVAEGRRADARRARRRGARARDVLGADDGHGVHAEDREAPAPARSRGYEPVRPRWCGQPQVGERGDAADGRLRRGALQRPRAVDPDQREADRRRRLVTRFPERHDLDGDRRPGRVVGRARHDLARAGVGGLRREAQGARHAAGGDGRRERACWPRRA